MSAEHASAARPARGTPAAGTQPRPSTIRAGIIDSLPFAIALAPVGLAFGYIAHAVGLSWWLAALMSAVVYAGPAQFIAAAMIGAGASVPAIVATTFVANLRYGLMGASLGPHLRDAPPRLLFVLTHGLADGAYALTLDHSISEPRRPRKDLYLLGSFLISIACWVPTTIAGALLGDIVPAPIAYGLGFATPAIFTAFLIPYVRDRISVVVMLVAGFGTVAGNAYLPSGAGPLIGILAAATLGAILGWKRERR